MKTTRVLTVLVVAFGLFACSAQFVKAAPVGTAFTYQGHLYDTNYPANDLYDFQFKLFDDPNVIVGNQVGSDVNVADVDVIDGYFAVELDFGSSVFNGDGRWLEIGVRQGELNDPNGYTTLSPRQEVTPTPYAIYAKTAGAGHSLDAADGSPANVVYVDNDGDVGIGTDSPGAKLEVNGDLKVTGAYKGNIGPNNGAPFPRPAYDSGWVLGDGYVTLFHNIGGNVDNYVVQSEGVLPGGGGERRCETWQYKDLTTNSVMILLDYHDFNRIRIWVYN